MKVTGVDLALRATGVARPDETFLTIKPPSAMSGYDRHWYVAERLLQVVEDDATDLVVLEDYAPKSPGRNSTIAAAEIGGITRAMLTRHRLAFTTVKPNTLKLYATGRGNASKGQVFDAALACFPDDVDIDFRPANFDEADAYWLRSMATAHYLGGTGKERAGVLERIDWPELAVTS